MLTAVMLLAVVMMFSDVVVGGYNEVVTPNAGV